MTNPAVARLQERIDAVTARIRDALYAVEASGHPEERVNAARTEICRSMRLLLAGAIYVAEEHITTAESLLAE